MIMIIIIGGGWSLPKFILDLRPNHDSRVTFVQIFDTHGIKINQELSETMFELEMVYIKIRSH